MNDENRVVGLNKKAVRIEFGKMRLCILYPGNNAHTKRRNKRMLSGIKKAPHFLSSFHIAITETTP